MAFRIKLPTLLPDGRFSLFFKLYKIIIAFLWTTNISKVSVNYRLNAVFSSAIGIK